MKQRFFFDEVTIRKLHGEGWTAKEIAKDIGCAQSTLLKYTVGLGIRFPRGRLYGPRHELTGTRSGHLLVLGLTGEKDSKEYLWNCKCDCGNYVTANTSQLTKQFKPLRSCGCLRGQVTKAKYGGSYQLVTSSYWHSLARGAEARELPFTISKEYVWKLFEAQKRKCALTGVDIVLTSTFDKNRGLQTASLDRIDNNLGYVCGNVRWVHKVINRLKWNLPDDELVMWCELVVNHNRSIRENPV